MNENYDITLLNNSAVQFSFIRLHDTWFEQK